MPDLGGFLGGPPKKKRGPWSVPGRWGSVSDAVDLPCTVIKQSGAARGRHAPHFLPFGSRGCDDAAEGLTIEE
jgi:hypothetical protein